MGQLSCDPLIHHLSHPHPLELTTPEQTPGVAPCAGCRRDVSGWFYVCRPCSFSLHVSCSQMPPAIHHPAHPLHSLSLHYFPAYSAGYFNCDACGRRGDGFSYRCAACDLDLHVLCAAMPLSVALAAHHHLLALEFFPPYQNKGFSCDICGNLGGNHWLYRCRSCEFDGHLSCATAAQWQRAEAPVVLQQFPMQRAAQVGPPHPTVPQKPLGGSSFAGGYPGAAVLPVGIQPPPPAVRNAGLGSNLTQLIMQGLVDGASQQFGQNLVQLCMGGLGGGGSGGGGGGGSGGGDGNGSSFSVMDIGSSDLGGFDGSSSSDY